MQLRVFHTTQYLYASPARNSYNEARLMPLTDEDQARLEFRLTTSPPTRIFYYDLPTGRVHHFNLRDPHTELTINATATVVTFRTNPMVDLQLVVDDRAYYQQAEIQQDFAEYLAPTPRVPLLAETDAFVSRARQRSTAGTASLLLELTRVLHESFQYTRGATTVQTPVWEVIRVGEGVCQDFAHVMLSTCRRAGIPSRYVSGYLYSGEEEESLTEFPEAPRPPFPAPRRESGSDSREAEPIPEEETGQWNRGLVGSEATHAWVECLLPDGRWRGFDPTNGVLANDAYIKVHYGREYDDVAPLRGVYHGPAAQDLRVTVRVVKVD